jgi:hypothetical protein
MVDQSSPSDLLQILQSMEGEQCQRVAFSYAQELRIHLGKPTFQTDPKYQRGRWLLRTYATSWQLYRSGSIVTEIRPEGQRLKGQRLIKVRLLDRFAVEFLFTAEFNFIIPPIDESTDSGLPHWELLTPYHTLATIGPGLEWNQRSSEEIVDDILKEGL